MLSKFKRLPGFMRFQILWNAAFFVIETVFAITLHSGMALVFMVLFGALLVVALYQAKWELEDQDRMAKIDEELARTYDDIFGNTRK